MRKTLLERNRERIAKVRDELLTASPPRRKWTRRPAVELKTYPIIDRSTGICYYEVGHGVIDLCDGCAVRAGRRDPLGGSERRCEECGRMAKVVRA